MTHTWLRTAVIGLSFGVAGVAATFGNADADAGAPVCQPLESAANLVGEIRAELGPVEEKIRRHPYIDALESGQVSRDNLRAFAGEQWSIINSDLQSAAELVARFGAAPSGPFFKGILDGEIQARDYLLGFAEALGWSKAELEAYEPEPRAQSYPAMVTTMSVRADAASVAAADLINFAVFGENLGRMAVALRDRYGLSASATAFFDFFATPSPEFDAAALQIIGDGLCAGASPRSIRRSARLLQSYELDFWDSVAGN